MRRRYQPKAYKPPTLGVDCSQPEIIAELTAVGAQVTRLDAVGGGVSDLLVSFRGIWSVLECKNPLGPRGGASRLGQKLRETQSEWISRQRAPVHVVRSGQEALEAIGAVRKTGSLLRGQFLDYT